MNQKTAIPSLRLLQMFKRFSTSLANVHYLTRLFSAPPAGVGRFVTLSFANSHPEKYTAEVVKYIVGAKGCANDGKATVNLVCLNSHLS